MAKIKIKNLSRESNNRLRLIKTATSGGEGIGEQTGAVFETEQEIGICLSPDSVLTDVIVFPRNKAEMDAYLAAKPTPNVVDIFSLPGTVVTDKDILVDIADESALDPNATIVTGFSYNKAQIDKAILDGNQEALYGTFQGYEGVAVDDPVMDNVNIDLNALKQIAQFSTVINGRYVFIGSSRIQNSMRKVINEIELHDNNGPYLPTIVSLMVKAGYAPLTNINVGPQDNAEGVSVKLMMPVVTGNEFVNPYITGLSTLINEAHTELTTSGHAKLIANKENQLLYFTKLNKVEVDAVLADTGISPDKILGEIQIIDRANPGNSSVRYISKTGLQEFTKTTYGDDYIVAFYLPLDVYNHGECWLTINLSTTAKVMKDNKVGGKFEFTMEADLKFAHWPEDATEYNAWLAQINTTRDNSSSFLSPFAMKRTVSEVGGVTEFKYDDISRLYIGADVPEGFKVEAKRMDLFIAQAQDSDVIGHWKHDAGDEHVDAPFTVEMFKASVADGTIQLVHGYYIFFNTVAVPEETITADTEATFNLQVYDNTLPEKTLKKKRVLNTSEVQIVDARFFPRDLGEQTAFVNAFGNPPIINLFNNPNVTMTGMVESNAVISFRRVTEADQGKLYPIGISYGKEQFEAVMASNLPDDTLVTNNRVYSGPITDEPTLNPSSSTLGALRYDFTHGEIKLVNGRYYHPSRPGVQHANRLTIVNSEYDYDGSQPVFEPTSVNFQITERRLSNPVQARVGGVNEEEWLTVKGLFTGLGLPTANWINPFAEVPGLTSEIDENNLVISFIKPPPEYNEKLFPTIVALNKVQLDTWLASNPEPTSTALKMSYIDDQGQTNTQEIPTSDLTMIINTPGYTVVHDGDYYLNVGYTMSNAHSRGSLEFIYGGLPEFIPAIINMDIEFEDARIALKGGMTLETDYEFDALRTATEGGLFADVVDSLLTPTVMGAVRTEDPDGTVWYDLEDIPRNELAKLLPYHIYVDKEQMDVIAATLQDTDLIAEIDWWENGNSYPSESRTITVAQYKELVAENFGYDGKILIGGRTTIPQRDIDNTKRVKSTIKIGQGGGYIPLTVEWNYRYSIALRTPLNTEIKPVDQVTWDSLASLNTLGSTVGTYDVNDFLHQAGDDWARVVRQGEEGKEALMGLYLTGEYIGDLEVVDGWTIVFEITETVNDHTNVDSITVAKLRDRAIKVQEEGVTTAWIYPVLMGVKAVGDTAKRVYRNHETDKSFTIVERTANFTMIDPADQ